MKKFLFIMITRVGDLLIKLVSVKVLVASVITWYALGMRTDISLLVVAVVWLGVVGFRYAEKVMNLVKGK